MTVYYASLFTVDLEHDFYRDDVCRGLEVIPSPVCRRRLRGHALLFRSRPGGATVVVEQRNTGTEAAPVLVPAVPIREGTVFTFRLRIREPRFPGITDADLDRLEPGRAYAFRNRAGLPESTAGGVRTVTLHEGPLADTVRTVGPAARVPWDPSLSPSPAEATVLDRDGALMQRRALEAEDRALRLDLFGAEEGPYTVRFHDGSGAVVDTEEVFLTAVPAARRLFGFVQVRFTSDVLSAGADRHAFRVVLRAREVRWVYDVRVEPVEPGQTDPNDLVPDDITLTNTPVPFSKSGGGATPPADLTFESSAGIRLREEARPEIALKDGPGAAAGTLVANMPNPRPDRLEREAAGYRVQMPLTIR